MAKGFNESAGQAKKNKMDYIKMDFGINKMRLVGDLRPRYAYWKKLKENNIPVECLSFDPEKEKFTNVEKDWFKHYFPKDDYGKDTQCTWSYVIQVIDLKDGKLKLCGLKKKLFDQIRDLAKDLGDPTDIENGWDIIFEKKQTGSQKFNVEYKLKEREIDNRALTDDEKETIKEMKPIDEIIERPTAEEQRKFIETAWFGTEEETNTDDDAAIEAAANRDDDIPF